jgi:PAS domain S-box-containing protein
MDRPAADPARELPALVITVAGPEPDWADRLHPRRLLDAGTDDDTLTAALGRASTVLIDTAVEAPLAVARRVRRLGPELQLVLVAPPDRTGQLRRAMLFTPGLGEPWLATPAEVGPELVRRAAAITSGRQGHARRLQQVARRVAAFARPRDRERAPILSAQYLATLLELLPEPVFALDENDAIVFANPVARDSFPVDLESGRPLDVRTVLDPVEPPVLDELLRGKDPRGTRRQLRLLGAPGGERIYAAILAPVPSERPVRALVLHEVTELVHARHDLEQQAEVLRARTQELARQAEQTRNLAAEREAVLGQIADGVIIVGGDGRINFVNAAAARIHGADHVDIVPERWAEVYNLLTTDGLPYPPKELPLARALLRQETVQDAEWLIRRPDGVTVHAQGSAAPVLDAAGQQVGAVLTLRDVTEQRRRQAERERLLDEIRDALEHRSRFYASMSHELRTPINAIIGYNELLLDDVYGPLPPGQRPAVERVARAARHLLELVNDVLDLSKIEAGKLTLEVEDVDPAALARDLEATMEPLARKHDVQLHFHLDEPACHRPIRTDPRRLRQILLNLLSNAIRYGAGRPVHVTCERSDRLRLRVRDQGPGIEPDQLEAIFEEFVQLNTADDGGTGLGLPIARRLAHSLGGEIHVATAVGEGSEFIVELPET